MSSSPTTKSTEDKEHKGNKEDNFSPFLRSSEWKVEWAKTNLKLPGWMSYPNSQVECLVWKKELPRHTCLKHKLSCGTFCKPLLLETAIPCRQM